MKKVFLWLWALIFQFQAQAQNVGIGIATPTLARFQVNGGVDATTAIFGGETSGISLQRSWPGVGFNQYYNGGPHYLATGYAGLIVLDPGGGYMAVDMFPSGVQGAGTTGYTRALVITKDGRLSIGNGENPVASLSVLRGTGNDGTAVFKGTSYWSHFNYGSTENTYIRAGKFNGDVYINDIVSGDIFLGGGSAKVGINITTSLYPLSVKQFNNRGLQLINATWGNRGWSINNQSYNSDANNPSTCLELDYDGRANNIMGWFRPDDGGYTSNSDIRMKEHIQNLEPMLPKLMALRATRYHFIGASPNSQSLGFIAQEAKLQFPELVDIINRKDSTNPTGFTDHHGISYTGFTIVAIKAIQEQQDEIEQLKKDNLELKNEMMELKKMVTRN